MTLTKKDLKNALKAQTTEFKKYVKQELKGFATKDDIKGIRRELKGFATKDDIKGIRRELKGVATKDDLKSFATKDYLKQELKRFATKADLKREIKGGIDIVRALVEVNGAKMDQLIEGYKPSVDQISDNKADISDLKPRVTTLEDTSRYLLKKERL